MRRNDRNSIDHCANTTSVHALSVRRGDRDGRHEVDVIADLAARGMVGIEIKAHSAPKPADARHLVWLRDELADRFRAGALLHTGPARYRLGDRIEAIPICTLWS